MSELVSKWMWNLRSRLRPKLLRCLAVPVLLLPASLALAQMPPAPPPSMPRGLVDTKPAVSDGYVLFSPILSGVVYLIDNQTRAVHTWTHPMTGLSHYMLPNGNLLRGARDPEYVTFKFGGVSGRIQELDWASKVVWEYKLAEDKRVLHHDIEPLPNGNVLALGWELKTPEEALAVGRRPDVVPERGLASEFILEIEPTRPAGGKVVWEWHVWDHLVQHADPKRPNHKDPADHPGRLDINAGAGDAGVSPEELAQLKALGYVPETAEQSDLEADFLHANAIDYNATLDQIAISVPELGEVWIIDHSTTTAEAAGTSGGRSGQGGDLLYRWGNPSSYARGADSSKRLFFQHDVRWIPEGWDGAGNLTIFNNGRDRPEGPFSSIDEIVPPQRSDGSYDRDPSKPFGPANPASTVRLPNDRFAPFISGAERLRNGNTFVCAGTDGILLEVSPSGDIAWEYRNPYSGRLTLADGSPIGPGIDGRPYAVFRATRIPPDHQGLRGKKLEPLKPQPKWAPPPAAAGR